MLNYGLKSQQLVLHANLQSEMVLTIFTIFFYIFLWGGGGIIFKVIMIETRCLQSWNSPAITFSKHDM